MTLRDLEAVFLKSESESATVYVMLGDERGGADGVMFLCPRCFEKNKGPIGTHSIICWFEGVPLSRSPGPGRWIPSGTSIDDLSFVGPHNASVAVSCAHFFVRKGAIVFAN